MGHTNEEIINIVKENLRTLYKNSCVNYTGVTTDTKEYYTEIIADFLLKNIDDYKKSIIPVERKGSYKVKGHHQYDYDPTMPISLRKEELFARALYGRELDGLTFLDYQVPLKNVGTKENVGLGKIDSLAWDGTGLVILELKKPDSPETLLRCVLEAYTYQKTVCKKKLAKDFDREGAPVRSAALIFADSQPYQDWKCAGKPHVKELMKEFGVGLYVREIDFKE